MNILEEIQNCPVEWKELGDKNVAKLSRGKVMSKQFLEENKGEFPVYSSQTANNGEIGRISSFEYDGEYITWTTDGANAGTVFYRKGKFSITNVCGLVEINSNQLLTKFVYYYLTISTKKYVSSGMGNPKLMSNVMGKIKIPILPLDIQEKIVQILDKMTEYATELTSELTSRNKQYSYYRNNLLSFEDEVYPVEWKELGEISQLYGGLIGKTKSDFENGNVKYVTYKNIFNNIQVELNILENVQVDENEKQNAIKYGDVLITGSSENKEEVGMSSAVTFVSDEPIYLNSFSFGIRFNEDVELLPEFTKYLFRSFRLRKQIEKTASGVTRYNVSKVAFKKIKVPLIPKEIQEKIVQALDKFDTVCNDISIGLPKEIELRQKQYEYWREQLLNFNK